MASQVDAPVVQGHAAVSLGIVLLYLGTVAEGIALMEEGYEIAARARDLGLLLRASSALASTLMDYAPDYERGRRILLDGIELSRRSGRRDHEVWMWSNIGNYAFDQGRIEELERAGEVCVEIGRSHSYPLGLGAGAMLLGQAAFLRGDLVAADRLAREAALALPAREEVQAAPFQSLLSGWIAKTRGDEDEELRRYFEGLDLLAENLRGGMVDELLCETVRALVRRDRAEEAKPHLESLRQVAPGRPNAEGFLWWAEGVAESDPEKLRAAANRFAELTRTIDEGRVLLDLADAGVDPTSNRARARELFDACGAQVYVRQVAGTANL